MINLGLLLGSCFVALILMEIVLRIYNPFEFTIKGNRIILSKNKRTEITNPHTDKLDSIIRKSTNSLGFRGEERPEQIQEYLSIFALGGSTTQCAYQSDGKTWPDVLGVKLRRHFNMLWINNAGLSGHSTFGHIVLMEDFILPLKPDVVLFLIGVNDVGVKDLTDWDKQSFKNETFNRIQFNSLKSFFVSMAYVSEVFAISLNMYRYVKARSRGLNHHINKATLDAEKSEFLQDIEYLDIPQEEHMRMKQEYERNYLKEYKLRLRRLIELSKNKGIEPVFITQPALYGKGIDSITQVDLEKIKVGQINGRLKWEILELYNGLTRKVGKEEDILTIDLASELPKNSKYYIDYIHYSNEGIEKVVDIIYSHLYPFMLEKIPE